VGSQQAESIDARLGSCVKPTLADSCITAWDGISCVEDMFNNLNASFNDLKQDQELFNMDCKNGINHHSTLMDGFVQEVEKRFADLSAFIKLLNDEQIALHQLLRNSKVAHLEVALMNLGSSVPSSTSPLMGDMASIEIQMKLLESRLPSHKVWMLGGNFFQSKADVALFIKKNIPTNTFAMFHDVVTFMERLSGNTYRERK
jgi:hypothetical protein